MTLLLFLYNFFFISLLHTFLFFIFLFFIIGLFVYSFYVRFFFSKQKTAYELRISDWSSDVCSSDLRGAMPGVGLAGEPGREDDAGPLLPAQEVVAPGGVVGREAVAGDRNQPAAVRETGERRADVLDRGGAVAAGPRRHGRKRRGHSHDGRGQVGGQGGVEERKSDGGVRRVLFRSGVGLAGEPGREDDAGPLLPAQEVVAPGGVVGREAVAGDRNQPAAVRETGERRADVLDRGGAVAAGHRGRGRKRRVHQHDGRAQVGRQVVVDLLGVVPGDRRLAVETGQESGAGLGGLVERQRGPGHLCEDGEQAGAGRRLQDEVAKTHSSSPGGDGAERDGRGELLEVLGLLGAPGLARQARGEPPQHGEQVGGCGGLGGHGRAELLEEQDLSDLDSLIGVLPGVGRAK